MSILRVLRHLQTDQVTHVKTDDNNQNYQTDLLDSYSNTLVQDTVLHRADDSIGTPVSENLQTML